MIDAESVEHEEMEATCLTLDEVDTEFPWDVCWIKASNALYCSGEKRTSYDSWCCVWSSVTLPSTVTMMFAVFLVLENLYPGGIHAFYSIHQQYVHFSHNECMYFHFWYCFLCFSHHNWKEDRTFCSTRSLYAQFVHKNHKWTLRHWSSFPSVQDWYLPWDYFLIAVVLIVLHMRKFFIS